MRLTMPWSATETHHNGNGAGISSRIDEIRQALGKEVDHLAKVAAQLSQELGTKASTATSDVTDQAATAARDVAQTAQANTSDVVRKLAEGAATIGPALALMGRKRAETIGRDVQSLGQDLRKVRLTTEPRKTAPDMMPGITLLGGFGAGIALMYFLDPNKGKARRQLLMDKVNKWSRIGSQAASGRAKDLANRAQGAMIEARKAVVPVQPESDVYGNEPIEAEPETSSFQTYGYGYGSTQTPESPENSERETTATIG